MAEPLWKPLNSGTVNSLKSIYFTDANNGYAVGLFELRATHDGGNSWIVQKYINDTLFDVHFIDSNIGYAIGANGIILKTIDKGAHWSFQNSGTIETLHSFYFTSIDTGYIAGGMGKY